MKEKKKEIKPRNPMWKGNKRRKKEKEKEKKKKRIEKPSPNPVWKKKKKKKRHCVLERAKGLPEFDYSLTMGPSNMCIY